MNPEDKIKKLIEESKIRTNARTENKILGQAFGHLNKIKQHKSPLKRHNIWRIIMKNKKTRLAAMVTLIFVITIVLCQFDQTSIALGQVKSAIHSRLLHLKELVAGTNKPAPSPISGQRGGRGARRGSEQNNANNEYSNKLSKEVLINMHFLTIEENQEELYDFFNREEIKLNTVQNNPEIWYTKLSFDQIKRFTELSYTIDVPERRAKPMIMIKEGQEGVILRSSGDAKDFAFSIVTNILDDANGIEMSLASLFGESEMEIPSIKTASDEVVLLCLTKSLTSNNEPNNIPETKISTLALIQAKEELPK